VPACRAAGLLFCANSATAVSADFPACITSLITLHWVRIALWDLTPAAYIYTCLQSTTLLFCYLLHNIHYLPLPPAAPPCCTWSPLGLPALLPHLIGFPATRDLPPLGGAAWDTPLPACCYLALTACQVYRHTLTTALPPACWDFWCKIYTCHLPAPANMTLLPVLRTCLGSVLLPAYITLPGCAYLPACLPASCQDAYRSWCATTSIPLTDTCHRRTTCLHHRSLHLNTHLLPFHSPLLQPPCLTCLPPHLHLEAAVHHCRTPATGETHAPPAGRRTCLPGACSSRACLPPAAFCGHHHLACTWLHTAWDTPAPPRACTALRQHTCLLPACWDTCTACLPASLPLGLPLSITTSFNTVSCCRWLDAAGMPGTTPWNNLPALANLEHTDYRTPMPALPAIPCYYLLHLGYYMPLGLPWTACLCYRLPAHLLTLMRHHSMGFPPTHLLCLYLFWNSACLG